MFIFKDNYENFCGTSIYIEAQTQRGFVGTGEQWKVLEISRLYFVKGSLPLEKEMMIYCSLLIRDDSGPFSHMEVQHLGRWLTDRLVPINRTMCHSLKNGPSEGWSRAVEEGVAAFSFSSSTPGDLLKSYKMPGCWAGTNSKLGTEGACLIPEG